MYRAIVVPLDGSAAAETALPTAEAFSRAAPGTLYLVRAAASDDEANAAAYLTAQAEALRARAVQAETHVTYGPAAGAIVREVVRRDADLIVMTTHGRGGLERSVFGSVADQVLHQTARPIVLVRPDQPAGSGRLERILVPLDGSPLAEHALAPAQALAGTGGEILLQQVVAPAKPIFSDPGSAGVWTELIEEAYAEAVRYLEAQAATLRAAGYRVRTQVEHGWPAQRIAEYARQEAVDLIVASSHGRAGAARWLLGSVADDLIRPAPAPLLLLRPLLAEVERTGPAEVVAQAVDPATIQPGYTVFAHPARRADHGHVGQFVGTVRKVFAQRGVHYLNVRGGIEQANELFIPLSAVRAVVHHQVHLNLFPEDLAGAAWHIDPAPTRA
jgi:nucleotide-binding universal stress UspA family protein